MKKLILISALLLFVASNGWADREYSDSIYGSMKCKVKNQNIMEIVDGVPNEPAPYFEGDVAKEMIFIVGMKKVKFLVFEYELESNLLNITITDDSQKQATSPWYSDFGIGVRHFGSFVKRSIRLTEDKYFLSNNGKEGLGLDENSIIFDSMDKEPIKARLTLERLEMGWLKSLIVNYKNDWSGLYTMDIGHAIFLVDLDCRPINDKLAEVLQVLEEWGDEVDPSE